MKRRSGCGIFAALLIIVLSAGCAKPAPEPALRGEGIAKEVYSIASFPSPSETNLRPLFSMADAPPDTPVKEYPYHLEAVSDEDPDLIKKIIVPEGEIPPALARRLSAHKKNQNDIYRVNPNLWETVYDRDSGRLLRTESFEVICMNSRVVSFLECNRINSHGTVGMTDYVTAYNIDPESGLDLSLNHVVNDLRRLSRLLLPKLQEAYIDARPEGDIVRQYMEWNLSEEHLREILERSLRIDIVTQMGFLIGTEGVDFVFSLNCFFIPEMEAPVIRVHVDFSEAPDLFNPKYSGLSVKNPPPATVKSMAQIAKATFEAAQIWFSLKIEMVGGIIWDRAPEGALEAGYPLVVIDADTDRIVAVEAMHDNTQVTVYSGKKKSGTGQHDYWDADETLQEISLNAGEVVLLQMEVPYTAATRCVKILPGAELYQSISDLSIMNANIFGDGGVYWQVEEPSASDYYPGMDYVELELWVEFFNAE